MTPEQRFTVADYVALPRHQRAPKWQYIFAAVAIVVTVGIGLWFLQYPVEAFGNFAQGDSNKSSQIVSLVVGIIGILSIACAAVVMVAVFCAIVTRIASAVYVLVMRIARAIEHRFEPTLDKDAS